MPRHRVQSPLPPLTPARARALQLAAQGLLHTPQRRPCRDDVVAAVARMRMLQIDSIHVVARSPYLVLFSRLGAYPTVWLEQALERGELFECWAHEACFAAAADHAWHAAARPLRERHWSLKRARRLLREQGPAMRAVLQQVRERGPLRAADVAGERPRGSGWWDWSVEKSGLEAWFALGDLMVTRREGFQRVYDLRERVLERVRGVTPGFDAEVRPDQVRAHFAADAVRALGLACGHWVADYHRQGPLPDGLLEEMAARGELLPVQVRGWERPAWVHRDHEGLARRAAAGALRPAHSTLLSPFDPLVWDRGRARELFGFDYALECYTPAAKRRYGYFVLPLLVRGRLAARVDAKAHRREGVFELRAVHLEPGERVDQALLAGMARAIDACARWHQTPRVRVGRCRPSALAVPLRAALHRVGHPH